SFAFQASDSGDRRRSRPASSAPNSNPSRKPTEECGPVSRLALTRLGVAIIQVTANKLPVTSARLATNKRPAANIQSIQFVLNHKVVCRRSDRTMKHKDPHPQPNCKEWITLERGLRTPLKKHRSLIAASKIIRSCPLRSVLKRWSKISSFNNL